MEEDRVILGVGGAVAPRTSEVSDWALHTLRADCTLNTSRTLRTSRPLGTLRPSNALRASFALRPGISLRTGIALLCQHIPWRCRRLVPHVAALG